MRKNKIVEFILHLLYPERCVVCDGILEDAASGICPECCGKLAYIKEPRCRKCGKQLFEDEKEFCDGCKGRKQYFDRGIILFSYNEAMKKSIYRFKYANRREYKKFYAKEICRCLGREIRGFHADAILPVPLHKKRQRQRGYNQAELIAVQVGVELGIPVYAKILQRSRDTKPLKTMGRTERENNLKKAFKLWENDVKLNKVIIIDDIITTGSTINEAAAVLREAGVREIYFVALSSGVGQ